MFLGVCARVISIKKPFSGMQLLYTEQYESTTTLERGLPTESRVERVYVRDIGGIESLDSSGGSAAASFFAIFGKFGIIAPRRENRGRSFLRHLDDFPLRIKWER